MRIYLFHNPKLKIDLDRTLGENLLGKRLVRYAYKFAKSVTKTSNKIYEPKTYDEAINNSIYSNKWYETIDKELRNLNIY